MPVWRLRVARSAYDPSDSFRVTFEHDGDSIHAHESLNCIEREPSMFKDAIQEQTAGGSPTIMAPGHICVLNGDIGTSQTGLS